MNELKTMLTYRRPADSKSELAFIERFLSPLFPAVDRGGNLIVDVGEDPRVLFASHTDTVHRRDGKQRIKTDRTGLISLAARSKSSACLGADDTAGVWLMINMIRREIPGRYVFHADEETGAHGAKYIANKTPELLEGITQAIEFDRGGTRSIVTHQMGNRCASDAYAVALGDELHMDHRPDKTGIFTDVEIYADMIPEVVNVSVGYEGAHTSEECLDSVYLRRLLDRVSEVDFAALPIKRDPYEERITSIRGYDPVGTYDPWEDDAAMHRLYDLVQQHPDIAASLLADVGITAEDMETEADVYLANIWD